MIHRFFSLLVFTCVSMAIYAQTAPMPFEIRNDTAWKHSLPDSLVMFVFDSTGKMDINAAVTAARNGNMNPWRSDYSRKGLEIGDYWFYYRISNKTGRQYEAGLDAYSNVANFHIVRSDKKIEVLTTGNRIPWSKKKEFRFSNVAVFTMANNETVDIYYHASITDITFVKSFRIDVLNPNRFARKYLADHEPDLVRKEQQNFAFGSGIYLTAAAIYFVFFFLVREKVFLFFAVFLLCLFVPTSPFLTSITRLHPNLGSVSEIFTVIAFTSFIHFIRQYLNLEKNLPIWDKIVSGFSIVFLILGSYEILVTNNSGTLVIVLMVLFVICLFTTFFLLRNRQQTEKKFLLYAVLPFLVVFPIVVIAAIVLSTTRTTDFLSGIEILPLILDSISMLVELSFVWMIISFSRLLFRRFNEQRIKIRDQQLEKEQILLEKEQEKLRLIEKQKEELGIQVTERTAELKASLENLKATQAQLIQSEKMASLGEMTAGIAHEIQNPLNFVNNFAEVNGEILQEIKDEIGKIVPDAAARENLESLIQDLSSNQDKIKTHGRRADSIVKNMLQHSRSGTSQKEEADFNALIDEYVKLSFHGMRAKDKTFNADFNIELDPSIDKVPILIQDFGRVILNLTNNAFYSVAEKKKTANEEYMPLVQAKTARNNGTIRLIISDNGNGISEKIRDKIFQPFFTTKPTGEGTGLGLSISYEIITKGHGGKMWVESKEDEGTSFIIEIPA